MGTLIGTAIGIPFQKGAVLNPTPSGYEALKDSIGETLKDSEGKIIYSLLV